jgi:hypothetical protein
VLTVVYPLSKFAGPALSRATLDQNHKEEADAVLQPIRAFVQQQGWKVDSSASERACACASLSPDSGVSPSSMPAIFCSGARVGRLGFKPRRQTRPPPPP